MNTLRHIPLYWEDIRPAVRWWLSAAVAVMILGLIFIRSWKVFTWPGFFMEDGVLWFNYYYGGEHALTTIFRTPQGYIRLNCELLAWFYAEADVCLQPYLYAFVALVLGVLTCMSATRLNLIKSTVWVLLTPVVLALAAIHHVIYFAAMIGLAWVLVIWFLLLLLQDPPEGRVAYLVHFLFILLLTWCHPYTLVGIPVAWLALMFFPGKKRLVTALGVTLSLAGMLFFLNPGQSALPHLPNLEKTIWLSEQFLEILTNEVFLFQLLERPSLLTSGITIAGIMAALVYLRDQQRLLKMSLIVLFIIASTVALFFLTNRYGIYRHQLLVPSRYLLIANFFWALLLMGWLEGWAIKQDNLQRLLPVGVAAAIGLVILTDTLHFDSYAYTTGQKRGQRVAVFVRAIDYYEGQSEDWNDRYINLRLGKKRRWLQPNVYIGHRSPSAVNVGALPEIEKMPFEQFIVRPRKEP